MQREKRHGIYQPMIVFTENLAGIYVG